MRVRPASTQTWRRVLRGTLGLCCALAAGCAEYEGQDPLLGALALIPPPPPRVEVASLTVTEGGAGDSFVLQLNQAPAALVRLRVTPDEQLLIAGQSEPAEFLFTPDESSENAWNAARTVSVSAVDDSVAEGTHAGLLDFEVLEGGATAGAFDFEDLRAAIIDNDSGGVSVEQSGGATNLAEGGGGDTFSIQLTFRPTSTVTITVTPDAQLLANGSATPIALTFTTANWNTPQTVSLGAVDDAAIEGLHSGSVAFSASSTDPSYNGLSIPGLSAQITDNDTPGVVLTESGGATNVSEAGSTDSYTAVLTSAPAANVTVTISSGTQLGCSPCSLVFTPGNWNTPQSVTVSATNDSVAEGAHFGTLSHSATSADANYNGIGIASLTASIADNDSVGVTVTESGGSTSVAEGGANDSYTIVLTSQPSANVTIAVNPGAANGVTVNGSASSINLTFTPGNWNTPQSVTVAAAADSIAEGAHARTITHTSTSGDAAYNGLAVGGVSVAISDNDSVGVTITESGGSTSAAESGATDTYTIVLTSQPASAVQVTVTPDAQTTANGSTTPVSLTFTPANWNSAQTVTVGAVNDGTLEGPHSGSLSHSTSSGDASYNGLTPAAVSVSIIDDDVPGITVTESGGSTSVTEGGATDSFTVVLNSQPTATVTIAITPDAELRANGSTTPITLTFQPSAAPLWSNPQTVTVAAVDDADQEANHSGSLGLSAGSADGNYNGGAFATVNASITDNDVKRVFVTSATTQGRITTGSGGVAGADDICAADSNKPASGTYRALLADGITRRACTTANCGGGAGENLNWVISANQAYYRTDLNTLVFSSDASGVLPFGAFNNSFGGTSNIWTGLNSDWTTSANTCLAWFGNIGNGQRGRTDQTGTGAIDNGGGACTNSHRLVCVEQ